MNHQLAELIQHAAGKDVVKLKFLNRLEEGQLTRSENPVSHLCVYFAAHNRTDHKVFIGFHRKSGLWLFNGGHMDPEESPTDTVIREAKEEWGLILTQNAIPALQLVSLTEIEHPERQTCEWHYDLWYFFPFDEQTFRPNPQLLQTEFSESGWKTYKQAALLFKDPASLEALAYCKNLR